MKLFKISDFNRHETEEGYVYHNCVLGTGLEMQIDSLSWGWHIGVYSIHGRLIMEAKQPFMITIAGGVNHELSHELMLAEVSKLYDSVLSRKQIPVKSA